MSVYHHAGITILSKHDPAARGGRPSRIALVLAGGAVAGGAFKAGGLRALDEVLRPRRLTELDLFIGLSAGAVLAFALAAGVEADDIYRMIIGDSERHAALSPLQFMRPNVREPAERIALFVSKSTEILASYLSEHRRAVHRSRHPRQARRRARQAGADRVLRS